MTCPDIDSFLIQGQNMSPKMISFGFLIDSCRNLAKDPEKECESQDAINSALSTVYVTTDIISQIDNAFANSKGISDLIISQSTANRFHLSPQMQIFQTVFLQKVTLKWSQDYLFGTNFLWTKSESLYSLKDRYFTSHQYNPNKNLNGYLTFELKQHGWNSSKSIVP